MFLTTEDLLNLPNPSWLIQSLLPACGQALLYGPSGEGKSFVAMDMALSVSEGIPFLDTYSTKQGHVLYIASEGGGGVKKRVGAWMQHHEIDNLPNITWFLDSLDPRDPDAVQEFLNELAALFPTDKRYVGEVDDVVNFGGLDLKLVVFDTLSRNFGGEDENASTAMTGFIRGLEVFTRQHQATVLTIHHTNALGARERGHSSLKGAMDVSLHCTAKKDGGTIEVITIETNKQKDDREEPIISLRPERVVVERFGEDEDGNPITSLVLTVPEAIDAAPEILDALGEESLTTREIEHALRNSQSPRQVIRQRLRELVREGVVRQLRGERNTHLYRKAKKGSFAQKVRG